MANQSIVTAASVAEQNAFDVTYTVNGAEVHLDLAFVKRQLVRGRSEFVSDQEVLFFINTCRTQKLDPRVYGDVYLIKYSKDDPAQLVVGKDAYMRRAHSHPDYLYKQDGIVVKRGDEIIQKEGCCLYPGEELVGGWCRVYYHRRGQDITAFKEVSLAEYNKNMANWKSKPATMINKVAITQCVREAFPKDFEGLYSEDELVASGAIEPDDPIITHAQRQSMFKNAMGKMGDQTNEILGKMIKEYGYDATTEMPLSVYNNIMSKIDEWQTTDYKTGVTQNSTDSGESMQQQPKEAP